MTYAEGPLGGFTSGGNNRDDNVLNQALSQGKLTLTEYFNSIAMNDQPLNPINLVKDGFSAVQQQMDEWNKEDAGAGQRTLEGGFLALKGWGEVNTRANQTASVKNALLFNPVTGGLVNSEQGAALLDKIEQNQLGNQILNTSYEDVRSGAVDLIGKGGDVLAEKTGIGAFRHADTASDILLPDAIDFATGGVGYLDNLAKLIKKGGPEGFRAARALWDMVQNPRTQEQLAEAGTGLAIKKPDSISDLLGQLEKIAANPLAAISKATRESPKVQGFVRKAEGILKNADPSATNPLKGANIPKVWDEATQTWYRITAKFDKKAQEWKYGFVDAGAKAARELQRAGARKLDEASILLHFGGDTAKANRFMKNQRFVYNKLENVLKKRNLAAKGKLKLGEKLDKLTVEHIFDVQHWWKLKDNILNDVKHTTKFSGSGADISSNITILRQALNSSGGSLAQKFPTDDAFIKAIQKGEFPDYERTITEFIENNMAETIESMTDTDWERLADILIKEKGLTAHEALWQYFGKPTTKAAVKEQYGKSVRRLLPEKELNKPY